MDPDRREDVPAPALPELYSEHIATRSILDGAGRIYHTKLVTGYSIE